MYDSGTGSSYVQTYQASSVVLPNGTLESFWIWISIDPSKNTVQRSIMKKVSMIYNLRMMVILKPSGNDDFIAQLQPMLIVQRANYPNIAVDKQSNSLI